MQQKMFPKTILHIHKICDYQSLQGTCTKINFIYYNNGNPNMSNDNEISNLSINLGLDNRQIRGQDGIDVKFTLTNNSNKTLNVLKWQLPIDGIGNNDLFWVKRNEEVAVYLGKVLKRAAPTPDDYITLDPNETISTDFDLAEVYDISKSGNYAVEFDSRVLDIGTEEPKTLATRFSETHDFRQQRLRSNTVQFNLLEDRAAKTSNGVALQWSTLLATTSELPNFRACTTSQQNQIEDSLSQAKNIVEQAQSELSNAQNLIDLVPVATENGLESIQSKTSIK